jgi:hypothetical protein
MPDATMPIADRVHRTCDAVQAIARELETGGISDEEAERARAALLRLRLELDEQDRILEELETLARPR